MFVYKIIAQRLDLSANKPFAVFVPMRGWLKGYKAIQEAVRCLASENRENLINSYKSIIVRFHNVFSRENSRLQNKEKKKKKEFTEPKNH